MPASCVGYPSGFTQPECMGKPHWNGWKDTLLCFEPSLLTAEEAAVWPTFVNQIAGCLVTLLGTLLGTSLFPSPNYWGIFSVLSPHSRIFAVVSRHQCRAQMSPVIKLNKMELHFHSVTPLRNSQELSSLIFGIFNGRSSTLVCGSQDTSAGRALRGTCLLRRTSSPSLDGWGIPNARRPAGLALASSNQMINSRDAPKTFQPLMGIQSKDQTTASPN